MAAAPAAAAATGVVGVVLLLLLLLLVCVVVLLSCMQSRPLPPGPTHRCVGLLLRAKFLDALEGCSLMVPTVLLSCVVYVVAVPLLMLPCDTWG